MVYNKQNMIILPANNCSILEVYHILAKSQGDKNGQNPNQA